MIFMGALTDTGHLNICMGLCRDSDLLIVTMMVCQSLITVSLVFSYGMGDEIGILV